MIRIAALCLLLVGCAQTGPVCFVAHSPSIETSDGVHVPSRTTKVCAAWVESSAP